MLAWLALQSGGVRKGRPGLQGCTTCSPAASLTPSPLARTLGYSATADSCHCSCCGRQPARNWGWCRGALGRGSEGGDALYTLYPIAMNVALWVGAWSRWESEAQQFQAASPQPRFASSSGLGWAGSGLALRNEMWAPYFLARTEFLFLPGEKKRS